MGGLGLLIAIALYVSLAIFVVWRTPKAWGKALAVAAVILLPTADAWWGRHVTLPELCKDAGLKVFKQPAKQQGLMYRGALYPDGDWERARSRYPEANGMYWRGEAEIRKYDLGFVEDLPKDGTSERLSLVDGKVVRESKVTPRAKYVKSWWIEVPIGLGKNFGGSEMRIEDRQTGEVISRYRQYSFGGGWAERFLGGFADSGPQGVGCPLSKAEDFQFLVQKTFE